MRKRRDIGRVLPLLLYAGEAREAVASVDVHGAGAADPLAARPAEREGRVLLILNLQKHVQNHGATSGKKTRGEQR